MAAKRIKTTKIARFIVFYWSNEFVTSQLCGCDKTEAENLIESKILKKFRFLIKFMTFLN